MPAQGQKFKLRLMKERWDFLNLYFIGSVKENSFAEKDVGVLTGKLNGSQQSTSAANKAKSILGCIRKNSQQGDGGGPYPQDKQSHL